MTYNFPLMTPQFSLYAHSDRLIEEFNDVLSRSHYILPTYDNTIHTNIDQLASVFNYWVQLIPSPEIRIAKVDRVILHDLTIKLNQFVADHELVHEFKGRFRSQETLFVLAYFVSSEILLVINDFTPRELLFYYDHMKFDMPYYNLTNDDLDRTEVNVMFDFRKTFVAQLHTPAMRRRLNLAVYDAIKKTRQLLAKQMSQ